MNEIDFRRRFWFFLVALATIRTALIFSCRITPQEAYYWNFSRHPAVGYFDHPPVTAWTIRIFTLLFGTNIFAIRLGALLYGIGSIVFIWLLSKKLWGERIAFWSSFAIGASPIFSTAGLIFTPDPPLIFFWIAGLFFFHRAILEDKGKDWFIAGFCGGLALLSKYTSAFWWLGVLLTLILTQAGRNALKTYRPYAMLLAGIIAFSPEIIWNYRNEWASFLYQSSRRAREIRNLRIDYFFGYLGSQFFAVSPILWLGSWWSTIYVTIKSIRDRKISDLIVSAFSFPLMFLFSFVGLFYWVKLNWIIPAYILPIGYFSARYGERKIFKFAIILAVIVTLSVAFVISFPIFPLKGELASTFGWKELAMKVEDIRKEFDGEPIIFGPEYKVPSMLAYYLADRPETVGPHLLGFPGLQYEYWCNIDTLAGKHAICVVDPRWGVGVDDTEARLKRHFKQVSPPETVIVTRANATVTRFYIWRCFDYIP